MIIVECYTDPTDSTAFLETLRELTGADDCLLQAVDARMIAGPRHVRTAIDHARRAIDNDRMIARDPSMELLLYLAGSRQIDDALALGIGDGRTPALIIIDGGDESTVADAVRELDAVTPTSLAPGEEYAVPDELKAWFDITDAELEATQAPLEFLVCERVALLSVDQ